MVSEIKIGLLVPQSKQYTALDKDFVRGVKASGLQARYFVESISVGADEQLIIDKIQKLSLQEDVNIIIAFFGHRNLQDVYEYTSNNNILLIVSEIGATLPFSQVKKQGVYINSLGLAESSFLLGDYLSNYKKYRNIVTSSSYYDVGYGIQAAIEMSLYRNDAQFSGHYITPFYPRENEAACMLESITASQPDAVFAFHSGLYAEEHASFVGVTSITKKYPFYMTSFSVNDKIIEQYGDSLNDVFLVGSWLDGMKDETSCNFTKQYKEAYQQKPSAFSLLGYESGAAVKALLETCGTNAGFGTWTAEFNKISVEGPRGTIAFSAETNRTVYDHYIFRMTVNENAQSNLELVELLKNDGDFIKNITEQTLPEQTGGWHNAYLCH